LMGRWPAPFIDVMQVSVDELLKHVAISKVPSLPPGLPAPQ